MAGEPADERLADVLERHRRALHALPGVVASGIGLTADTGGQAIQVFVRSQDDVDAVRASASELLGDTPLEVIVTGEVVAGEN